jgi:hypothetical protein
MTPPTPKDELPMCTCGDDWHAYNAANHAPSCPVLTAYDALKAERDEWETSSTNWQADCRVAQTRLAAAEQTVKYRESAIATHARMLTALLDTNATADDFANLLDPEWFEFAERIESLRDQMGGEKTLKDAAVQREQNVRDRARRAAQILVEEIGADGAVNVEQLAKRACDVIHELRTRLAAAERDAKRYNVARQLTFGIADWGNPHAKPMIYTGESADALLDAALTPTRQTAGGEG